MRHARKPGTTSIIAPRIRTFRSEGGKERFRRMRSLQKFVSIHPSAYNHFNLERHVTPVHDSNKDETSRFASGATLSSPSARFAANNGDWFALA
jgi:hypothetical protein